MKRHKMKNTLRIYPNREKNYERELKRLAREQISAKNKELITEFLNYLFSIETGEIRAAKLSSQLRRICLQLNKDLDKATTQDIQNVVAYINRNDKYKPETKADYRRCIKQFYAWYKDIDPRMESEDAKTLKQANKFYKYIDKNIKRASKIKSVDYSNILNEEDIKKVIEEGCTSIREKAFIALLHESGFRAGELLNMKIKDVQIMKNRALITVDGKTGERRVPIIHSLPYLVQWLDLHPYKQNRESYVWLGEGINRKYDPLKHKGGQKLIDRCFERAGFIKKEYAYYTLENGKTRQKLMSKEQKKPCNYHWFRHSRATLLASHLTEQLLCKFMGWALGSKQVRRYCHLGTQQVENAILSMNGLEVEKKILQEKPQECVCGTINTPQARYCYKCGNPLSVSVMVKDQEVLREETDRRMKAFAEIMSNPDLRKQYDEFKRIFLERSAAIK